MSAAAAVVAAPAEVGVGVEVEVTVEVPLMLPGRWAVAAGGSHSCAAQQAAAASAASQPRCDGVLSPMGRAGSYSVAVAMRMALPGCEPLISSPTSLTTALTDSCIAGCSCYAALGERNVCTVLMRVYGLSVELFFDREDEVCTFEFMSQHDHDPRLLGRFLNGRVKEFIHAKDEGTNCTKGLMYWPGPALPRQRPGCGVTTAVHRSNIFC